MGAQDLSKGITDLEKSKTAWYQMKNLVRLRYTTRIMRKKKWPISSAFGVKETRPVIEKPFQTNSATSVVACVAQRRASETKWCTCTAACVSV